MPKTVSKFSPHHGIFFKFKINLGKVVSKYRNKTVKIKNLSVILEGYKEVTDISNLKGWERNSQLRWFSVKVLVRKSL